MEDEKYDPPNSETAINEEDFEKTRPKNGRSSLPTAGSLFVDAIEPAAAIRRYKIVSLYVAACPPDTPNAFINNWKFVCRINHTDTYELELKALPPPCRQEDILKNDTYIKLARGPDVGINGRLVGMAKTLKVSIRSHTTIGGLVDEIFARNLNQFQLFRGRGKRDWMFGILQTATYTFHARDDNDTAMTIISQAWNEERPIRPGVFLKPEKGLWVDPDIWTSD